MKRLIGSSPLTGIAACALAVGCLLAQPARAQDTYEPDDTPATAKNIVNGDPPQTRAIGSLGDVDWATFTIGANGAAQLRIETLAVTGFSGNTEIWLYEGRNLTKEIAYNDDANATTRFSLITLTSLAAGTYYIKVGAVGNESIIGGYTLKASWVDRPDSFEVDNTPAAAKSIINGLTQERSIHALDDEDWATFTVGTNGATNLRIETSGVSGDTEMWLFGPNSTTAQLAYNDDGNGKFAAITQGSLAAGTYFIKVTAFGFGSTISSYTLRATWTEQGDSFESDDTPAAAKPITNGVVQNHTIHFAGDVDWATFTIGTNGANNIRIETAGTAGDTEVWLYGPNSPTALLSYNDDSGNGKFSVITVPSLPAGTYHVKIGEFGNDNTIGGYTLRVSWIDGLPPTPGDSFENDDTPAGARPIANGQRQNRSIHVETDVDWVSFTIPGNGANDVRMETSGGAGDTEMWLYGPGNSTTQLAYDDDGGSGKFATIAVSSLLPGTYYVRIQSYRQGSAISAYALALSYVEAPPLPPVASRLANLSVRTNSGTGAQTVIVGFVVSGIGSKQLLLRGIGPTLTTFGVTGVLADPTLQLYSGPNLVVSNDNWGGSSELSAAATAVAAFALPAASRDAALLEIVAAGPYTAQVGGGSGVTLVEAYETSFTPFARLTNVSARAQVGTGANVLIVGFVIVGDGPKVVLIRAVGPGLAPFGVTGALANPRLDVFRGTTATESNDNWGGTAALTAAFVRVGAFALPNASQDAALLTTLPPGAYSAQVSGVGGTTGNALVEVYEVP